MGKHAMVGEESQLKERLHRLLDGPPAPVPGRPLAINLAASEQLVLGRLADGKLVTFQAFVAVALLTFSLPLTASIYKFLTSKPKQSTGSSFLLWGDGPSLILLSFAAVGLTLIFIQWRLMSRVFEDLRRQKVLRCENGKRWTEAHSKISSANGFFGRLSRPLWMVPIGAACLTGATLIYLQIANPQEFYGFLAPGDAGDPQSSRREAWSEAAFDSWWASGSLGAGTWIICFAVGAFAITIQILCGARFMLLCNSLAKSLQFGLEYGNTDGDYGRSSIKTILSIVYAGVFVYAVIILDIVFMVRGSGSSIVLVLVIPFLLLNVAYIFLPLAILRQHGRQHRTEHLSALLTGLDANTSPTDRLAVLGEVDRCHKAPLAVFRARTLVALVVVYAVPTVTAVAQMWELFAE